MKAQVVLLAAAATPCFASVVSRQQPSFLSEQLLQNLESFPSSDPIIASLIDAIKDSTDVVDEAALQFVATPSTSRSCSRAQAACQALERILPGSYTDSQTSQASYDILRRKNWSSNCDLSAACFVTPEHPAQVAAALQVISAFKPKFAVRSGGHNPNPGFAGVGQEGVTVDTGRFQTLQLSADKSVATVGAGLRFGAVQAFLDSKGVAVVSGRNSDVGVSGLLLGGGHPIINSLTGLAADNIKSVEIVLSDFRVVTASRTQNSDLFRALKGGGNNFGVVTKFELYTNQPRNIWYRLVTYGPSDPRAVLDALAKVQKNMESDAKAGIQMTCTPAGFNVAFVYGKHTNDPAVFAPFRNLAPLNETRAPTNGTTLGFIQLQSPPQPEASRDTVGVTTLPDTDLYLEIYNQYLAIVQANKGVSGAFLLPIQTFGATSARIAERNGGNVLGTSARAQTWFNPIAQWTNPVDYEKVHTALLGFADFIKSRARVKGAYDKYIFANIAAKDQNVLASYGSQNLDFLRQVSRKYDRAETFQKLQNGGFLISKS